MTKHLKDVRDPCERERCYRHREPPRFRPYFGTVPSFSQNCKEVSRNGVKKKRGGLEEKNHRTGEGAVGRWSEGWIKGGSKVFSFYPKSKMGPLQEFELRIHMTYMSTGASWLPVVNRH